MKENVGLLGVTDADIDVDLDESCIGDVDTEGELKFNFFTGEDKLISEFLDIFNLGEKEQHSLFLFVEWNDDCIAVVLVDNRGEGRRG
ncbi:MAG: hypothetical protein Q7V20_11120 [Aquabacterium sp.]|uniref:hypothetical protein n=1 Tax=Aquabacterium sp. TaxID=1872578 RepID=UPI0027233D1D|nr:hypothetical protein [Aquabacterium sp.]MDO9003994.1 hypothetical protein [Aquabacterium sp.]